MLFETQIDSLPKTIAVPYFTIIHKTTREKNVVYIKIIYKNITSDVLNIQHSEGGRIAKYNQIDIITQELE